LELRRTPAELFEERSLVARFLGLGSLVKLQVAVHRTTGIRPGPVIVHRTPLVDPVIVAVRRFAATTLREACRADAPAHFFPHRSVALAAITTVAFTTALTIAHGIPPV